MRSSISQLAVSILLLTGLGASAQAQEMPAMAKKLGCTACHAIDKKIVGPAWKDVADRYTGQGVKTFKFKDKEYPLIEGLVMKVSQGGAGNWGTVPMLANDPKGVHKDDITELVKFEQSLATKKRMPAGAGRTPPRTLAHAAEHGCYGTWGPLVFDAISDATRSEQGRGGGRASI